MNREINNFYNRENPFTLSQLRSRVCVTITFDSKRQTRKLQQDQTRPGKISILYDHKHSFPPNPVLSLTKSHNYGSWSH